MPRMPRTTLDDQFGTNPMPITSRLATGGFRRPFCVELKLKAAPQPHTDCHKAIIWEEFSCSAWGSHR